MRPLSLLVSAALVPVLVVALGGLARAADEAAGGYQPFTPGSTEQVSAPLFVVVAYSVIWIVLLLYVFAVWLRQRRVAADLAHVRQQLDELDSAS